MTQSPENGILVPPGHHKDQEPQTPRRVEDAKDSPNEVEGKVMDSITTKVGGQLKGYSL